MKDIDPIREALENLERYAHMSDQERADINDSMNRTSAGNVGYDDVVSDTVQAALAARDREREIDRQALELADAIVDRTTPAHLYEGITKAPTVAQIEAYRAARLG